MKKLNLLIVLFLLLSCTSFSQSNAKSEFNFGHVDSFTINKKQFRIRMIDSTRKQLILEKFDAKWVLIDYLENHIYTKEFDINHDGFNDVGVFNTKLWFAYLFNPKENTFVSSGYYSSNEFNKEVKCLELIDSTLGIYFDFQPKQKNQWVSCLFQIKNFRRTDLGYLSTTTKRRNSKRIIGVSAVKRYQTAIDLIELEGIDEIKFKKNESFDYVSYWKQNWRKFLPKYDW